MKTSVWISRTASFLLVLLCSSAQYSAAHGATNIVISEIYGGGGNSGAAYTHDFVELYNPTGSAVDISGWSVQYASAAGGTWSVNAVGASQSIAAYGYYLIQLATGGANGAALPPPDATGASNLSSTTGKIALCNNTTPLAGSVPSSAAIVDLVGFGSGASAFEGTSYAPAIPSGNTSSIERKAQSSSTSGSMGSGGSDEFLGNGRDANDNGADFVTRSSVQPQNSSSSTETPPPPSNEPPLIASSLRSPFVAEVSGTDTVTAVISDSDGSIINAYLHYTVNGGAEDSSAMVVTTGSTYRGIIPSSRHTAAGNLVEYFISATDDSAGYSTTGSLLQGYFVGNAPISSIKTEPISAIIGYGARVNGTINVRTNTYSIGYSYLQDATGGIQLFQNGALPDLNAGRNAKVQGTLASISGSYRLAAPNFAFVDTNLGTSPLTPATIALPLTQSPSNSSEGRLVKLMGMSTDSTGAYVASRSYLFRNGSNDTVTVVAQSNSASNTLIGATIAATPVDAIGVLVYVNSSLQLKPRSAEDMGTTPGLTFEAIQSGSWKSSSTWSGGVVPGAANHVTMTTSNVVVTIDSTAACNNLTMIGVDTTGGQLGPELQFASSGAYTLTVHGRLDLTGGTSAGNNTHGGKPKLSSNGNSSATLVAKRYIFTDASNTQANGDGGLNMNEGTVKLLGSTSDTLRTAAGLRLGNLIIGDGTDTKTILWRMTSSATMNVRSLTVRSGSSLLLGSTTASSTNSIGNASTTGLPMLTGGITIESGASLLVNNSSSTNSIAHINIKTGGLSNSGTLNLKSPNGSRLYHLDFGGLSADTSGSSQMIGGSATGTYSHVFVGAKDTLTINRSMNLDSMFAYGRIAETAGNGVTGSVVSSRNLIQGTDEDFGGIGITINAADAAPGSTDVRRITGTAQSGGGYNSIARSFDIIPTVNTGLNATIDFHYEESELNGNTDEASLQLWKSTDAGSTWTAVTSSANTSSNIISAAGVNSFSRWTAADANHPMGGGAISYAYDAKWNMISLPMQVSDPKKISLYPTATSSAFAFEGAYVAKDTILVGTGYWLKFASAETVSIFGGVISQDSFDVVAGWNMIGSITAPVLTSAIGQDPPNNVVSQYYKYNNAYLPDTIITPGRAYWVKTNTSGKIILSSSVAPPKATPLIMHGALNSITISDANSGKQTLYFGCRNHPINSEAAELPPLPPAGLFDARFGSQKYVETFDNQRGNLEFPITIQTSALPVTIRWDVKEDDDRTYLLTEANTGVSIFRQTLSGEGSVTLRSLSSLALQVKGREALPIAYSLSRNYPNPFNPTTRFSVALPTDSHVELRVYDVLGRLRRTLMDEWLVAGVYTLEWDGRGDDGSQANSGIYFLRMISKNFASTQKMILLK